MFIAVECLSWRSPTRAPAHGGNGVSTTESQVTTELGWKIPINDGNMRGVCRVESSGGVRLSRGRAQDISEEVCGGGVTRRHPAAATGCNRRQEFRSGARDLRFSEGHDSPDMRQGGWGVEWRRLGPARKKASNLPEVDFPNST